MKPKIIYIALSCVMALLSSCAPITAPATPTLEQSIPVRRPAPMTWETTDNLSINSKNLKLDILHIIVMPKYIMLISAVSGNVAGLTNNIQQADVLNEQKQIQGQAKTTTIREFKQGRLVALTFLGQRQNLRKPLFSITALTEKDNNTINGIWQIMPLELPTNAEDSDSRGMFANGVTSAIVGDVTIFSSRNFVPPVCKGDAGVGGPDMETFFTLEISDGEKKSCLYAHISQEGDATELSEKEYLRKLAIWKAK